MPQEKKPRVIAAVSVLFISLITYLFTVAPTVSFWDCGEFIACANILGIPHPPGTPFFMILGRAFIILFSAIPDIALRVNLISAISSAFGVMFCFLFTEHLLRLSLKEGKKSTWITMTGGLVASLLLTFSDTYWFNAVEAEVYGSAMLLLMCISWLSLIWVETRHTPKGNRIIILICYLAFLGAGFNPYSLMSLPAVFLMMLLVEPKMRTNIGLIATGVVLVGFIISMASSFLWAAIALLIFLAAGMTMVQNKAVKVNLSVSVWCVVVAIIAYSTHAYIPIRSALNPRIDENNPETWDAYVGFVERKQYGSEGMLKRAFHRRGAIGNQLFSHPHMGYGGYMLAQYLPWKVGEGRSSIVDNRYKGEWNFEPDPNENEPLQRLGMSFNTQMTIMPPDTHRGKQIFWFLLFHIPMLFGAVVMYKTNKPFGAYALALYILASAGVIFYMNFSDGLRPDLQPYKQWVMQGKNPAYPPQNVHMEVRERDYFYVPGYMFMSILFGLSAAYALVSLRSRRKNGLIKPVGAVMVIGAFIIPCFSNYHEHNRKGMYIPYDYARNLLNSCLPNSILFTNGDNDTFPLWFMQEVENVRKDVRVVNLSLGNTDWYIHQLLTIEPKVTLGFTHDQISGLQPQGNALKKAVEHTLGKTGLKVTLEDQTKKPYYKVQDILVMNIVQNNYPRRPIHFAVTVSNPNMMGLEKYMKMDGMVYTLTNTLHNQSLDAERTAELVDKVYFYRGLKENKMYLNSDTKGMLSNYFATNHRLARWAQDKISGIDKELNKLDSDLSGAESDSTKSTLQTQIENKKAEKSKWKDYAVKYINKTGELLPWDWRHYYFGSQFYKSQKDFEIAEKMLKDGLNLGKQEQLLNLQLGLLLVEQAKYSEAEILYNDLMQKQKDFQVVYALSEVYDKQGKWQEAKSLLSDWVKENPNDQYTSYFSRKISVYEQKLQAGQKPVPAPVKSMLADSTASLSDSQSSK